MFNRDAVIDKLIAKDEAIEYVLRYLNKHKRMTRAAYPHIEYSIGIDTPELDIIIDILDRALKDDQAQN